MRLPLFLGRIVCAWSKHKRGVLDDKSDDGRVARYRCPRCSVTWTCKVVQRKQAAA